MMKRILFLILVAFLLLPSNVLAEELENNDGGELIIEIVDEAIKLDLTVDSQNYPAKEITFKVVINPEINIARAQIAWIYNDRFFTITGDSTQLLNLKANEEVILYKTFNTKRTFTFVESRPSDFGIKVTGLAFDKNYLSTRKLTVKINGEYEVVPLLTAYEQQKNIINIIYWLLGIIAVVVVVWLIILGIKRFRLYLNSD